MYVTESTPPVIYFKACSQSYKQRRQRLLMCIVYVDYHKDICQLPSIAYEILKNRNYYSFVVVVVVALFILP